jgi:hypothetical protein
MFFTAIVMVCQLSVPPHSCDEANAIDFRSIRVESELGCTRGFQEIMARGGLDEGLGVSAYLKTKCVRHAPALNR